MRSILPLSLRVQKHLRCASGLYRHEYGLCSMFSNVTRVMEDGKEVLMTLYLWATHWTLRFDAPGGANTEFFAK